jgi:hypothetical protein
MNKIPWKESNIIPHIFTMVMLESNFKNVFTAPILAVGDLLWPASFRRHVVEEKNI